MEMQKNIKTITCFFLLYFVTFCDGNKDPKNCNIRTRVLNFGDTFEPRKCYVCACAENGLLRCKDVTADSCPELPCDQSVQTSTPDRCCKICPGTGARCRFNGMSVEDGESFQLNPSGWCVCENGRLTCEGREKLLISYKY